MKVTSNQFTLNFNLEGFSDVLAQAIMMRFLEIELKTYCGQEWR